MEYIEIHTQAMRKYFDRDFQACVKLLDKNLETHRSDKAAKVIRAKAIEYIKVPPPENWSGVERLKSKNEFPAPENAKQIEGNEKPGKTDAKGGEGGGRGDGGEGKEEEAAEDTVGKVFAAQDAAQEKIPSDAIAPAAEEQEGEVGEKEKAEEKGGGREDEGKEEGEGEKGEETTDADSKDKDKEKEAEE